MEVKSLEDMPSPPPHLALNSPKLSALHARLSLPPRLPLQTLARCLVHPTADPDPRFNNASLCVLGTDVLGYYTSEHVLCHYPRLPITVLFAAQYAYVGPRTLTNMASEWGIEAAADPGGEVDPGLLQFGRVPPGTIVGEDALSITDTDRADQAKNWRRGTSSRIIYDDQFGDLKPAATPKATSRAAARRGASMQPRRLTSADYQKGVTHEEASTQFVRALFGAIYLHLGTLAAKRFYTAYFLSRHLDLSTLFSFTEPTRDLARLCAREGWEPPIARLISETGRLSRSPVFVVGIYSGRDKLGEGVGASLDEGRIRAAAAALKSWYLYSPLEVTKPSEVEGSKKGAKWIPNVVDIGEVIV